MTNNDTLSRAQGCLLGQLAGDALGSLVEFQTADMILKAYPDGVRHLADGGVFNTIAGQPTDDSEMALLLARMLVDKGIYEPAGAFREYEYWLDSGPFDCGFTIRAALEGELDHSSQANGAMMRISPLGIFGATYDLPEVANWARQDALLTHPNPVCLDANALFAMAIAEAVKNNTHPEALYHKVCEWGVDMQVEPGLAKAISSAADGPPTDYISSAGWVLIAFQNAFHQLLHAANLEEGVVNTVMQGGDTDTNAAICGALLGAVYGRDAIPTQWENAVLNCAPDKDDPRVKRPRPQCFWPVDALELARELVEMTRVYWKSIKNKRSCYD